MLYSTDRFTILKATFTGACSEICETFCFQVDVFAGVSEGGEAFRCCALPL
jgi:hypothetical protein